MLTFEYTISGLDMREVFYQYSGKKTTAQETKDIVNEKWIALMNNNAVTYLRSVVDVNGQLAVRIGKQQKKKREPVWRGGYCLVGQASYKKDGTLFRFMLPCYPKPEDEWETDDDKADAVTLEADFWMTIKEIQLFCRMHKRTKLVWLRKKTKGGTAA